MLKTMMMTDDPDGSTEEPQSLVAAVSALSDPSEYYSDQCRWRSAVSLLATLQLEKDVQKITRPDKRVQMITLTYTQKSTFVECTLGT